MQTGEYQPDGDDKKLLQQLSQQPDIEFNALGPDQARALISDPILGGGNRSLSEEASRVGWGQSRYDTGDFRPEMDLEDARARNQSGFAKILNGAAKGGVVAATTAVETVAGVIDGLLEGTGELARQALMGEDIDLSKAVGRGVNNFTARTMADIQSLSEEWFPNYRTAYERTDKYQDEWYKHIFTANFIGDSFLKNFGFTVGAIAGGAAWSKAISAGLKAATASDLLKGVVAAAEGSPEAKSILENAMRLVNEGKIATIADDPAVAKLIGNAAKELNKMSTKQQLFGGIIGAMGEGTFEGVMARNEFLDQKLKDIDAEYAEKYRNLEEQLAYDWRWSDMVTRVPVVNPDGTTDVTYRLNDKAAGLLKEERDNLAAEHMAAREYAQELGDRIAATTFVWNLPILTVSNTMQFGRMLSGGFNTTRKVAKTVGEIAKQDGKLVGKVAAVDAGKRAILGKTMLYSARNAGAEAAEEMLQGFVSSGAKHVADARITSFNDDGYDREALSELGQWANGMLDGGMEYLKNGRNWQEGFLGMMTGLIGIPGRQWNGGVADAYREARDEVRGAQDAADALNTLVNSERFQNAMKGYVRHQKYETEMADGIKSDDRYSWRTANDKQLINDIITFANAGRLQDLNDIVDYYANMSEDDSQGLEVVEAATGNHNENEARNNPAKIVQNVKERAKEIKDSIKMYNDMYDAMSTIAPLGTSRDQIEEMIAASMNIKAFEKRFLSMFEDIIKFAEPYVGSVSEGKQEDISEARSAYNSIAQVLTNVQIPLSPTLIDDMEAFPALTKLNGIIRKYGDDNIKKEYADLKKVAADRKAFVNKLLTLRGMSSDEFEAQAKNADTVIEEQKTEEANAEIQSFINLAGIKAAYNVAKKKNMGNIGEFIEKLRKAKGDNSHVSHFLDLFDAYSDLRKAYVRQSGTLTGIESEILDKLLEDATDVSDLTDSSRIDTYEQWMTKKQREVADASNFDAALASRAGMMGVSKETYDAAVQKVVNAMRSLDDIRESSPKRGGSEPAPEPAPAPASATAQGDGKEPAAPASRIPQQEKRTASFDKEKNIATDASGRTWSIGERVFVYDENKNNDKVEEFTVKEFSETKNGDVRMYLTGPREMSVSLKTQAYFVHKEDRPVAPVRTDDIPAASPTGAEVLDEAAGTGSFVPPAQRKAVNERGKGGRKQYYQTAIPEFTVESAKRYFEINDKDPDAFEKRKAALKQLVDFIGPRVGDKVIEKLISENAWTNAVKHVKVGDRVQFLAIRGYEDNKGKPVIFMAVEKEGRRYIFNVMRRGGEGFNDYEGLKDFIDAFDLSVKYDENGEYVFPKQSTVWGKRDGIIDYVYADNYVGEAPIAMDDHGQITPGIEGYDENAPIVWVNGQGLFETLRGNPSAARSIYSWRNMDAASRNKLRGALYYLADDGNGGYIPIRLGVEHFTPDNYTSDSPTFAAIRRSLSNIEGLAGKFFNEIEQAADDEARQRILEEENKALHQEIANGLRKYVDLTHGFFTFIIDKDGKPWLRYDRNSTNKQEDDVDGFWLNHDNYNHLMDDFAEERVSLDLRPKQNLNDFIKKGFITSNAKKLLPKQVDVYIEHWKDGDFVSTEAQKELIGMTTPPTVEKEVAAVSEDPVVGSVPEMGVLEAPSVDTFKPGLFSSVEFDEDELAGPAERTPVTNEAKTPWELLSKAQQDALLAHYGDDFMEYYNDETTTPEERQNKLDCVGVA